jgi:multiple sugar transport system ATP-binding protein
LLSADGAIAVDVPDRLRNPVLTANQDRLILGVRPLHIQVLNGHVPESNVSSGTVYVYERLGTKGVLTANVGKQRIDILTPIEMNFNIDDPVKIAIDNENITVFDPSTQRNVLNS